MQARSIPGYLVCTHPRSGSTYFCELLASTGKLGKPAEYFNEGYMSRRFADPGNLAHLPDQFQHFHDHAVTDNGVRGCKVFWFDLPRLAQAKLLHRLQGYRFILLERADKIAQAISTSRALQTGKMHSNHAVEERPAFYDYQHIKARLERLLHTENEWRKFLSAVGGPAAHCVYEDIVANPQDAVDKVAAAVELGEQALIDPSRVAVRVQRDKRSSEWYERFVAEARLNDPQLLQRSGYGAGHYGAGHGAP